MKLVQILLPLRDNQGRKFDQPLYAEVHDELISRFGGVTAYTRSPARGLWQSAGSTKRDDVIIEWKPQKVKDIKGNMCEGGFLCIHFWITKRRIV